MNSTASSPAPGTTGSGRIMASSASAENFISYTRYWVLPAIRAKMLVFETLATLPEKQHIARPLNGNQPIPGRLCRPLDECNGGRARRMAPASLLHRGMGGSGATAQVTTPGTGP